MVGVTVNERLNRFSHIPKNHCKYVWFGEFGKDSPDCERFGEMVDYLISREVPMSIRFNSAEDLTKYYEQVTNQKAPNDDLERLFNWVRSGYTYDRYPIYSDSELKYRRKKYESYSASGNAAEMIERNDNIKAKGGMVNFSEGEMGERGFINRHKINPNNIKL